MFRLFVHIEVLGQIWEVMLDEIPIDDRLERTVALLVLLRDMKLASTEGIRMYTPLGATHMQTLTEKL